MEVKDILFKVVERNDLTSEEAYYMIDKIMKGEIEPSQAGAYLTALRMKGETITEIAASAKAMRDNGTYLKGAEDAIDIVGTGGDKSSSINISSIASFIIAAAGVKVAKHGNRSVSSKCGAADVYEALGVNITTTPEDAKKVYDEIGMIFLFAQVYHKAMKNAGPIRKQLGYRTVFNILGPLTNPCHADKILLGSYSKELVPVIAEVAREVGIKNALIVHGEDGLDEVTLTGKTYMAELRNGVISEFVFDPKSYGFEYCELDELVGGDPFVNKEIALKILNNENSKRRDAVVLNAGLAIYIATDGISIQKGIDIAKETLASGKALRKLEEYVVASNK
ncbi:MAG: anthranilate phosphoribosyltransferase [Acholeplasmatales bacterium]|nr:anthranilate phosphoribosyltransferase [Acholeplasmatales bacterium]